VADKISELLDKVKNLGMTLAEREEQRRSFAYGSAHIENDRITRDTVVTAEEELKEKKSE
jgi:Fic family protein